MSLVCFIAVSYFGSRDVAPYIESLISQTDERWVLRLVDNSNDDEEAKRLATLAERDSRIEVLSPCSNLGYFGGAEWARRRLDSAVFDWIAVTNTDVALVGSDFVGSLISISEPQIAVGAPAVFGSSSRSPLNPYMRSRPTVVRSWVRRILFWNTLIAQVTVLLSHLRRRLSRTSSLPQVETDIYAAHGCFMLFGKSYFAAGGNFSHSSFLFGEELTVAEFCRDHGLRTTYFPGLEVQHKEHANTGLLRSRAVLRSQVAAAKHALELISGKGGR